MNAIELLKQDHRRVRELFADHEKVGENAHAEKRAIGDRVCKELDIHAQIEEEIFYPAARDGATTENDKLVAEALEEHQVIKDLIAELRAAQPGDAQWDAKMKVLQETVEHHVEEEEGQLFPSTRTTLGANYLDELGQRMAARKRALTSDESIGTSLVKLVTRAYDSLTGSPKTTSGKRRTRSTRTAKPARARATRRTKAQPSRSAKRATARRARTTAKRRAVKRAASSTARSLAARRRKAARTKKSVSTGRARSAKVVKNPRRTVKARSARR
jgi:hemerythrin-like domain-containing protein